jgi:Family of unknown function (DUF6088)
MLRHPTTASIARSSAASMEKKSATQLPSMNRTEYSTLLTAHRSRVNSRFSNALRTGHSKSIVASLFKTGDSCNPRSSVDQALSRLVKRGEIARVSRGVFVRPKNSRYVGQVMPELSKVAQAIATAHGETIQVHGAEAARLLGLTTQMPLQSLFYTSGRNREIKVGNLQLVLKHVAARKLALSGRPSGLALSALWYLGKEQVSPRTIETIREKLTPEAFEEFKAETRSMPAWMADTLHRYEQGPTGG